MADEENDDEEESYDLTPFFADEPGAELMSLSEIKRFEGEDLEVWRKAMKDEIDSLQTLEVYEELTKQRNPSLMIKEVGRRRQEYAVAEISSRTPKPRT